MRAKQARKIENKLSRAKRADNFWKNLHFSPYSSKLRSDYLFSFQKRTDYLYPAFSQIKKETLPDKFPPLLDLLHKAKKNES